MTRWFGLSRATGEDEGFALLTVLGFVAVVTSLMLVAGAIAERSLSSSTQHVTYEGALSAAEDGIDKALARAQADYEQVGSDSWFTPGSATSFDASPDCSGSTVAWPFTSQPTALQERSWARQQIMALTSTSGCVRHSPRGDYVILKPTGHQAVYSMGWYPSFGAPGAKSRLLKAEYIFAPYSPSNAILTGGNLEIDSSTLVTSAGQACPGVPQNQSYLAGIHSNGTISVPQGQPKVCGPVSSSVSSGTTSSGNFYDTSNSAVNGTIPVTATQSMPRATASQVWAINHATNPPGGWYDLCADGTVHAPDGSAPCAGTLLSDVHSGGSYRGWTFGAGSPPTWYAGSGLMVNGYSGTYYINGGNVVNNASNAGSAVPNLTVIAAASQLSCNKVGGDIDWDMTDIVAPSVHSTFMFADQDLRSTHNFYAGGSSGGTVVSGFFIAGDQVDLETSANGAYGAVIAMDECTPAPGQSLVDSDKVKNPNVYYDPNAQAPFIDVINTTLWLEYPAG